MGTRGSKIHSSTSSVGTTRSTISRGSQYSKPKNFTIEKEIVDPRYGGRILLVRRFKNTRDYVLFQKRVNSQLALEREIRLLNRRILSPNPNLLRIDCFTHHDEQACCDVRWVVNIYVEYLEKDLAQELAEKRYKKAYYMEHELVYLIENLCNGLHSFEKSKNPHGDVKPANIFIDSFGVYKFLDNYLIDFKTDKKSATRKGLLAPELLNGKPTQVPPEDQFKADIFSLGMTLLEAATLEPSIELYDFNKNSIDQKELECRLDLVKMSYSQEIYKLLQSTLMFDPCERVKIETVCQKLSELGDSVLGKGAIQSYVLDRVHANQGLSTQDLSFDRPLAGTLQGIESLRDLK